MRDLSYKSYGLSSTQNEYVFSTLLASIKIVETFFNGRLTSLSIVIAGDFEQYCKLVHERRTTAGVTMFKEGVIFVSNPYLWNIKVNNHSLADLKSSLIHEITQAWLYDVNPTFPAWIVKGLGVYLGVHSSKQARKRNSWLKRLLKDNPVPNIFMFKKNFYNHPYPLLCYIVSYRYVGHLIQKFGKSAFTTSYLTATDDKNRLNYISHGFGSPTWKEFVKSLHT